MVYFYDASALRPFGRSLCLLLLLLLVPSCRSQAPKYACFKPTDGYKYPGFGKVRVNRSVLGLAVRRYVRGNQAVRTMYGQNINDWCVGSVTAMDYMFFGLATLNEPLHDWDVSSVTTMQGMVRISTNHECCHCQYMSLHGRNPLLLLLFAQFYGAESFNRNIGSWNVAAVTDMSYLVRIVMEQTNASCHLHA
jgi:surface protein